MLQYIYMPEVQVGYNPNCGYTSGALVVSTAAYTCSSYSVNGVLAQFYFTPLPAYYTVAVLTALQAVITQNGQLGPFVSGGSYVQLWPASAIGAPSVPTWTFEPTENALPAPAGSSERCISFNRMSYIDFLLNDNADLIAQNQQNIAALTHTKSNTSKYTGLGPDFYSAFTPTNGNYGVPPQAYLKLTGSGATLTSKLMFRVINLIDGASLQPPYPLARAPADPLARRPHQAHHHAAPARHRLRLWPPGAGRPGQHPARRACPGPEHLRHVRHARQDQ
jgi:hypothetical protein